jgi:hypothetical protein
MLHHRSGSGRCPRGSAVPVGRDAAEVFVPLALVDAAAVGYLLIYAVRRERRDKPVCLSPAWSC